jgi:hypothetical protein
MKRAHSHPATPAAGDVADLADDGGGDDRVGPEQPGQAGPAGPHGHAGLLPGLTQPGVKESLWVAEEVEKARLRHLKVFALTYDRTDYVPTVPVKNHLDMRRRRDLTPSLVKQLTAVCGTVDQHAPRDPIGRNLAEDPRGSGDFGIPVPYSSALVRDMRRTLRKNLRRVLKLPCERPDGPNEFPRA